MISNFRIYFVAAVLFVQIARIGGQSSCQLDDLQRTPGICTTIRQCRYAIGQLYASGPVKRCSGLSNEYVCCPTAPTLSQMKCDEWKNFLLRPETFAQPPPSQPICGYKGTQHFIVGGRNAQEFEFPHAVGLGYGNDASNLKFLCGATLISERYLLTAGHCLTNKLQGKPRWAVIGDLTLNVRTSLYRKIVAIDDWIPHPNYSAPLVYNDIAILRLKESLEISRYVLPACIGDPVLSPKDEARVSAVGWGQLGYLERTSDYLQAVNLTVMKSKMCNDAYDGQIDRTYKFPQGFVRTQICAGDRQPDSQGSKDTCNGDSGGGLVINPDIRCLYHVVGVTSFGSKTCGYGTPGVYTKVASYVDWIERTVWG